MALPCDHLLRRHGPVLHAHVHDLELVRAGEDEEDAGAALAAAEDAAEAEDDHLLVLQKVAFEGYPKVRNHGEGPY